MNRNILYISYDGMTDPLGQSQVLPYIAGLSRKGYRFSLISFEKPGRLAKDGKLIETFCKENAIDWHPMTYTKRPPVLSTLLDVRKMKKKALALHREKQFSMVHCRSYISALAGLFLKQKKQTAFLFDMRGFWADERVEGKIWNLENPLFRLIFRYFKQKERAFFSGADAIISLTESGKKEILKMEIPGVSEWDITVIPCCADLSLFDPETISAEQKTRKKNELGIAGNYIVGYVGSIGTWYMLEEMLAAFRRLLEFHPDAVFLFINREDPGEITRAATRMGIPAGKIVVTGALHREVPLYISLFDVSLFFIRPTFSKKASSPTKQGEIMAMGIPLICNAGVGDTDTIVQAYRAGIVLSDTTSATLENFTPDLSVFDAESARKGAREIYSLENGVGSYAAVYGSIRGEQKSEICAE